MQSLLEDFTTLEKIHRLFLDNEIAFVSYRTPFQEKITTMLQWQSQPAVINDIKSLKGKSGFVFAPFHNQVKNPIRLIVPDLVINGDVFEETFNNDVNFDRLDETPQREQEKITDKHEASREEYMAQVNEIKNLIAGNKFNKLVLSRISKQIRPENFNPSELFNALHLAYPDAFVYILYIPDTGLWCGASPEPLLQVSENMASTVSLAGTRKYSGSGSNEEWDEKELLEQEMVTTYIEQVLKKFNIRGYSKTGPHSHRAGNIEHLRSVFSFPVDQLDEWLCEFIDELHPTPSVCGLPKNAALNFLKQTEKHDREYYAGFLGPVNIQDEWNLFVNLRCMKAGKRQLAFFLGAGITAGSDPLKEWEETESKKNTMQSIVQKITES